MEINKKKLQKFNDVVPKGEHFKKAWNNLMIFINDNIFIICF